MVARRISSVHVAGLLAQGSPNAETLEAFILALASVDYSPCANGDFESGFEKAALYAVGDQVKHSALQQEDGTWKSKLASDEDIRHTLAGLEGPTYGKVIAFLKRPRKV